MCKANRKGVLTKSDLNEKVNWAASTFGWTEVRYSMCWGRTFAWIQWQVSEHAAELRRNHPECLIDVICWGQWGCIPTRIAPGAAYRDPTVTTEAVAKKVRRSADVLAPLAGEPDVGFVKIIGVVEASLTLLMMPLMRTCLPNQVQTAGGEVRDV